MTELSLEDRANLIAVEFDRKVGAYTGFSERLLRLVSELMSETGIRISTISARVKKRESLWEKVLWRPRDYPHLESVTDIVGVRIITYFVNDIDAVANLIEGSFLVDKANSIDKRRLRDGDSFGYQSLHYVVALSEPRVKLPEFARFAGLKAEIQIRSLLQHAWAEIEHDLEYKNRLSVPIVFRRRFARLAGLLEIADEEFRLLREAIPAYVSAVERKSFLEIRSLPIDTVSIRAFGTHSLHLRAVEEDLADSLKSARYPVPRDGGLEAEVSTVEVLVDAKLLTIGEVEISLYENAGRLLAILKASLPVGRTVFPGESLFFLALIVLAQRMELAEFETYVRARYAEPPPDLSEHCRTLYEIANDPKPDVQIGLKWIATWKPPTPATPPGDGTPRG